MDWIWRKGRRKDKDSPTPPISDEQKQYLHESSLRQRVLDADFYKLVQLPHNVDLNEWLATHTIAFFNHVNLMHGVVSEYCTSDTCSSMVGPDNVQYQWQDEKGKKLKQSAPQYIDHMMSFIQKSVTDEALFPTKFGQQFPGTFPESVKKIQRYLFHVLAHLYHSHYNQMAQLGLQGHLNTLFLHFMVFSMHFGLLQEKESEVLMDLHKGLLKAMQDPDPNQNSQPNVDQDGGGSPETEDPLSAAGASGGAPGASVTACGAQGDSKSVGSTPLHSPKSKDKPGSGSSGSENGVASAGRGVRDGSGGGGGKTLVDIPST